MPKFVRKTLSTIKRVFRPVAAMKWVNKFIRRVSRAFHHLQFLVEWGVDNPEYFDHEMDLHYLWPATRASFPMERGVWSSFALKPGGTLLDLCCGDGFYSKMFYSLRSSQVVGIDFDPEAIRWTKRNHASKNIRYILGDIRYDIPEGPFDTIVWDAAVEHFTEDEIKALMGRIKAVLAPDGVLSGYTIVEPDHGGKHLHQHEYEFHDKADLARFFKPHFKNVQVMETVYPTRTNLYFYATDGDLPHQRDTNLVVSGKQAVPGHTHSH